MHKCHSIVVTCKVQDIGFRSVVEHIGRKLDKGNLLLTTMVFDNKTGFNNLNLGLNNLTTMMYEHNIRLEEHNTRLEAILEKLAFR